MTFWLCLAFLVVGMSCPILAFLVFKPVLVSYYGALAAETKKNTVPSQAVIEAAIKKIGNPYTAGANPQDKGDRRGIVRPKFTPDEDE